MLEYVFTEAFGFALITGEVGCGKTTVVQRFLGQLRDRLNIALITNTHLGFGPLLPWVMEALGLRAGNASPSELYRRFAKHAKSEYDDGQRIILVIDEAQNLGAAGLEELRVLSNLNTGRDVLLQTILVGQPELRALLRVDGLRQFAQRIAVDHHLEPLQPEETEGYIRHRIGVAGGRADLFTPQAIAQVHAASGGVPRIVNILCDTALVYGFAEHRQAIDGALLEQVLADRVGGVLPLRLTAARAPAPS
jgi:general secretion pathway protein A